jgi:hypothetical protein
MLLDAARGDHRGRSEKQRRRVHQLGELEHVVVLDADAQEPPRHGRERRGREAVDERLDPVHEIEVVVQHRGRRL